MSPLKATSTQGGDSDERSALLDDSGQKGRQGARVVNTTLTVLFVTGLVVFLTVWNGSLPKDPHKAALAILSKDPVIVRCFRVCPSFDFCSKWLGWPYWFVWEFFKKSLNLTASFLVLRSAKLRPCPL